MMTRTITALLALAALAAPASAQSSPPASDAGATREATQTPNAPAAPPDASGAAPEGAHVGAYVATGEVELGYRIRSVDGSLELYRSQVDLQQGPTLAFSRVELRSPDNSGPIFDDLVVEGSGLFGEPESYMRARASKRGVYVLDVSDRTVDTFNYAPDFANPLFDDGVLLAPHGWDRRRRTQTVALTVFPQKRIEGHFFYNRTAQSGLAYGTEIASDSLIYDRNLDNRANEVRGGVTFKWPRWTLTLDQGARFYEDDETAVADPTIVVNDPELLASYRRNRTTDLTAPSSRAVFTARPLENLEVTARTLYTDYGVDGTLDEALDAVGSDPSFVNTTGRLDGHAFLFDSTQSYRLFDRLTLSNWLTYRRTRTAGDSDVLFTFGTTDVFGEEERIATGYRNAWLADGPLAEYDVTRNLTVRAGYTFSRRTSFFAFDENVFDVATGDPTGVESSFDEDDQRLDVLTVGGAYRLRHDARLYVNYENGRAPNTFFGAEDGEVFFERPGDFQRLQVRGAIRPVSWVELVGSARTFDRSYHSQPLVEAIEPPLQRVRTRSASGTVRVTPDSRYSFGVTYDRLFSTADITYLRSIDRGDGTFADRTFFLKYENRENDLTADVTAYPLPRVTLVGFYSLVQAGGSLPVHYHQGQLRGLYEFGRGISGVLEWRLFDYDDHRYTVTDYRANLTTVGVRWSW